MLVTKGEFKNFVTILDARISHLESEINTLKDWLAQERAEKQEFKELLFQNMGIIKQVNDIPKEVPKPINTPKPWNRVRAELEQKERDKVWANKIQPEVSKEKETVS